MKIKRYERFTRHGVTWSPWFKFNGECDEKWQLKNKLKNDYMEVSEEEWKEIEDRQKTR